MALNINKKTSPQDVDSSSKGDLIVNSGSDIVSLPVGGDGQILEADSAEVTGIKWSDKPLSTTAKGDLITYNTEPSILPAGSDGQVLTVASATAEGIQWSELGGLNLTEVKYVTTSTIDKTYPGTGNFNTNIPGVIDFIGTDSDTLPYSNVDTDDKVDFIVNGSLGPAPGLVDKNYTDSSGISVSGDSAIVIDLKRDAYIKPTHFGLGVITGSKPYDFDGSNDGVNWTNLGSAVIAGGTTGGIYPVTSLEFYRYLRYKQDSGVTTFYEIEVYGEIVPDSPTYEIEDPDNNKLLLVPFGNPTQVNMPAGIGANGFTCQVTPAVSAALPITITPLPGVTFIGQNFTIDNLGEVATIYQVSVDTYVVSVSRGKLPLSTKGDLLTHNGTEPVVRTIGSDNSVLIADSAEADGIRWGDVSTIVSTPFTTQRLDLNSTLQLTGSNARYLYLSAVGGTQDVILTDPPSTNDYFYIVNRDGANPIQIKEIAAGGVVQTLNSDTPVCQAQYDGVEWQIISMGTI